MIGRIKNFASSSAPLRLCARYFSTPRALNDYATHVPILIGLATLFEIRTVLEFGCGYYSTLTFLNRSAFPELEKLQSIENDPPWAETIEEVAKDDQRWSLKVIDGEMADSVPHLDLEAFDLILIDDSKNSAQRAATIRAIAARRPERPLIVIHDYEVDEYREAARAFKYRHTFKVYNPYTGLVCNKPRDVKSLNTILNVRSNTREPDDVDGWIGTFRP